MRRLTKDNDIQFEKNNIVFNYRVAIVIKNKEKILVQKDDRVKHFTLPGGRCAVGESSIDTATREFYEETGLKINFVKSMGMIENFFVSSFNGKKYHEILMINELSFEDKQFYHLEQIENIEDNKKNHISYIWKTIDELKKEDFKPKLILNFLDDSRFIHLINKESNFI